jgi:membrane protein involved in colicin uptake
MGGFATVTPPKPAAPLDLNALNLPGFGNQLRSNSASIPASVKKDEAEKTQKAEAEKAKAAEKAKTSETAKPPAATAAKGATLDDVVKSLDMLNKQMGLLIGQQDSLMRKQERNIKSAASANVQDKV